MIQTLITLPNTENASKKLLLRSIARKKKVLQEWMAKVELIRMELEMIEHEYNVRIGYLLLKDNQLDLEIIQLKNLQHLIHEGMSYEDALRHEEDKFYNEILRMQKEQEKLEEEKEVLQSRVHISEEAENTLKNLWKKLIRQFHPDLVQNIPEKVEREQYMKQINNAYAAGDINFLQNFSAHNTPISLIQTTREELEQMLIDIENATENFKEKLQELRSSNWWEWKKKIEKAKKLGNDVFAPFEKNLLDDITKKILIARELRKNVGQAGGTTV